MNAVRTHTPDPASETPAAPGVPAPDLGTPVRDPGAPGPDPGPTSGGPGHTAPGGPERAVSAGSPAGFDPTSPAGSERAASAGFDRTPPAGSDPGIEDRRGLSRAAEGLRWLLQDFVEEVPGVYSVAVVSSDGLLLLGSRPEPDACPARPGEARMDLAAVVSGLASLTVGAAKLMDGGRVRQTTVAMDGGMLLVTSISDGSLLGVHAAADCDVSVAGYHMARFVARAGHVLTPALRGELRHATATGAVTVDGGR